MLTIRELIKTLYNAFNQKINSKLNNLITDLPPVATSGSYNDLTNKPTIYTDVVRYSTTQSLTDVEKQQARTNIRAADASVVEVLINTPKDGITFIDQINGYTYIACMRNGSFVTYCAAKSIEVTTMPTKTEYMAGEYFDPTGMIVTATAYDGTTREITDFSYSSTYLTERTTMAEITYVEYGITHITTIPITVTPFNAATVLVDFEYTDNGDGTYTITGWKGTYNGAASTEIIIPNNGLIIV